jgi:hypothetical protein
MFCRLETTLSQLTREEEKLMGRSLWEGAGPATPHSHQLCPFSENSLSAILPCDILYYLRLLITAHDREEKLIHKAMGPATPRSHQILPFSLENSLSPHSSPCHVVLSRTTQWLFCWIYYVYFWLAPLFLLWCPWFTGLVFLWSHRVLAYSFHSSWIFCLRILLFFFNVYFVFKLWHSVFHLFQSAGVAFNCIFYLI